MVGATLTDVERRSLHLALWMRGVRGPLQADIVDRLREAGPLSVVSLAGDLDREHRTIQTSIDQLARRGAVYRVDTWRYDLTGRR
jgi:predicted transcriptional regulator